MNPIDGYTQMSRKRFPSGADHIMAKQHGKWKRISMATWLKLIERGDVPWDHTGAIYKQEQTAK